MWSGRAGAFVPVRAIAGARRHQLVATVRPLGHDATADPASSKRWTRLWSCGDEEQDLCCVRPPAAHELRDRGWRGRC